MSNNNSSNTSYVIWIIRIILFVGIAISIIWGVVKIYEIDRVMEAVKMKQNDGIHLYLDSIYNDSIYNCLDSISIITQDNLRKEIYSAAHDASESFVNQTGNLLSIFGIMMTVLTAITCILIPLTVNKELEKKTKEQKEQIEIMRMDFEKLNTRRKEQTEKFDIHLKSTNMFAFNIRQSMIKTTKDILIKLENYDEYKKVENATPDEEKMKIIKDLENKGISNSELCYKLGKLYSKDQSTYNDAIVYFEKAVNNNPEFVEAYLEWANVLENQKKWKDSWEKREKAIHLLNLTKEKTNETKDKIKVLKEEQKTIENKVVSTLETSNSDTITIRVKKNVAFNMIFVRGGFYKLGETQEKEERYGLQPYQKHKVLLDNYYIGETVVTQKLWSAYMNCNPSNNYGDNLPVETVSWEEANDFIVALNADPDIKKVGMTFRLPTSAEWEYAARGGHKQDTYLYSGNDDIDEVAWYEKNSGQETHSVKKKKPNGLKLYDMSGNVFEWCQDFWCGYLYNDEETWINPCCNHDYGLGRICRGGGWGSSKESCKITSVVNGRVSSAIGFRLVAQADTAQ